MQQNVINKESGCIMPNLHMLMDDSVVFEQAHTCNAICSPARASLMTGTLPHTHGMVDCTHTVPPYRAEYNDQLDTITRVFHEEGYHVSYYGKWHIERTHKLENYGIDVYETELHIPSSAVTMTDKIMVSTPGYPDKMVAGIFSEDEAVTDEHYIYQKAIEDIEANKNSGKPFCTFLSTNAPHDPYCVPQSVYDLYENCPLSLPVSFSDSMEDKPAIYRRMRSALASLTCDDFCKVMRCYYSYCTLVDIQIGKLIRYLKDNDLYDNTLIICLSDHGDMMGAHGMMMKSVESFEEIYRIPLIMKLPGQKMAGEKKSFYITINEVGPTVLDLVGCRPLNGDYIGQSLVPWLNGEKKDGHYSFAEFFGQRFAFTQRIYWQDHLKYVFNAFDYDELYDLEKDPFEMQNLVNDPSYQDLKTEMCKKMWQIVCDTDDTSLADATYYLMRFAPIAPGPKKTNGTYSLYNKVFG
jgi:arylsulfatase A-like enzyme